MKEKGQKKKLGMKPGDHKIRRILFLAAIVAAAGAMVASALFLIALAGLPSTSQIADHTVSASTKLYERTGTIILYDVHGEKKRTIVPFEDFPSHLKNAAIATEDEDFYEGPPFSIRGIVRSAILNLSRGEIVGGGSTITQQLARNAFLTPEQTIMRKLRELILAIRLDRHYTKDDILARYLNEIPFGSTLYGAEAASQAYFGRSVRDISLKESAVLIAMIKAPSYYSPWGTHVEDLLARSGLVLRRMRELGMVSEEEVGAALAREVNFLPRDPHGIRAPHFSIMVQEYLVEKYGEDLVREGGLMVRTTLDWELQEVAERVVKEGAERNEELYDGTNAALVAEDPLTGQILALVGSRDYFDTDREGNFNVAIQGRRQPGSALKPFVYLTAFMNGYTPETVLFDVPTEFSLNAACPIVPNLASNDARCFHPENFDGAFRGPVSLRTALAQSINVPAVKTLYLAGLRTSIDVMRSFGLTTLSPEGEYGLSLVLGGGAVRLVDLVSAYATLARDGAARPQSFILEVKDRDGNILERFEDGSGTPVVDPQFPRLISDILSDIEARSGLFQSSLGLTLFEGHDVALKTGTSNDYRDAWTVGYTPSLVVGVWAGNNDYSRMRPQGSSILAAVPIWSGFMREALSKKPFSPFVGPDSGHTESQILRGNYAPEGEVHSILHFINRGDPEQRISNPSADPQYPRWEGAVQKWLSERGVAIPLPVIPTSSPRVFIESPAVGEFVGGGFVEVVATIRGSVPLSSIEVTLDDKRVVLVDQGLGTEYELRYAVPIGGGPSNQLLLKVTARNTEGVEGSAEVIVYTQ